MACTFDSPCLTSQVNGVQPSFGFKPHNTGYFGIQASFTHGTHKCYETAAPTWQPVIKSGAYDVTCTWVGAVESIYCPGLPVSEIGIGTHTLSYSAPRGSPSPFEPTTFVVGYPPHNKPVLKTKYITITVPSTTSTKTYKSTKRETKTTFVKTGTLSLPGPTKTSTKYTNSKPHPQPTTTTKTEHTKTYKTKTATTTTTADCGGKHKKPEKPAKPESKPWEDHRDDSWNNEQSGPEDKADDAAWKQWGADVWGEEMEQEHQGPSQEEQGSRPQQGDEQHNGAPKSWGNEHPWGVRAPQMNYDVIETVSAGATVRVQMPCHGSCGGWSGPDATFTGHDGPHQTGWGQPKTITKTKTTTKSYGVKTMPTTTTKKVVSYRTKKYPASTTSVVKYKTTTKTLPPKFTPKWTKTSSTTATWTKTTTTSKTKTIPCRITTITTRKTLIKTDTIVETLPPLGGGDERWGGEGEWAARATATVAPGASGECADCNADEKFDWASVVAQRKAELAEEAVNTLTAGAKFRF